MTLLGQGLVHAAGVHLSRHDEPGGNGGVIRAEFGPGYTLLRLAHWEEGIALSPGQVRRALELTADAPSRLPRQMIRVEDPDGKEAADEGGPIVEVLRSAGVQFGHDLRGPALATYLVVEAADGYRVVFALPELDPACTDRVILLADRLDGKPIDAEDGPLRVVVPGEKRHARWVKRVVALKVGRA